MGHGDGKKREKDDQTHDAFYLSVTLKTMPAGMR
jgi:hypothetical protein